MIKRLLPEWEWMKGALPGTVAQLEQCGRVRALSRGELIIKARQPQQDIYIQMDGKSMAYNLTHTGNRKILFIFSPGTLLNEHVGSTEDSSCYCEAIDNGTVFIVPITEFQRLMAKDFGFTCAIIAAQEKKMQRLERQLKNTVSSIYLENKLAAKLWKLARDFGIHSPDGIEINMTLPVTMLADMLGTSRETASRLCHKLVQHGLIKMTGKRICVVDLDHLLQFYKT